MKILIINGSHRQGNTDQIIDRIISILSVNHNEVKQLVLRNLEMQMPDGCEACADSEIYPNIHDQFSSETEPNIRDYDIYIIATPTYCDGVTPLTKIFFDRIVSWCHPDRMYLQNKKIALITHGMADQQSWQHVINWLKSVCVWEKAKFVDSFVCQSSSKIGSVDILDKNLQEFAEKILQ